MFKYNNKQYVNNQFKKSGTIISEYIEIWNLENYTLMDYITDYHKMDFLTARIGT